MSNRVNWFAWLEAQEKIKEIDKLYNELKRQKCKEIRSSLLETCKWWFGRKSQVCGDLAFEFAGLVNGRCCYAKLRLGSFLVIIPDTFVDICCRIGKCNKNREELRRTKRPYQNLAFCYFGNYGFELPF